MENYEELLSKLEEFERTKPKEIPKELEDFIGIVARTGDPIYPWSKIKLVYRLKIVSVLAQFFEGGPSSDNSQFSYESMKAKILERFDLFRSAPFTIQRLSELLINPRKEYNRIDKFMRAIEKNILVVSVAEPGCSKHVHLNGSVEIMEEGFQVSSTSVYEEYRQRVAGIMENEVAAATISEDGQADLRKEGRCKKVEDDIRMDDRECSHAHKRTSPRSAVNPDDEASSQARLTGNQGSMVDHQEYHRLEFALAETDTLAIVEIVSEVDCPPDGAEVSEDSNKDYPLDNSMIADDSSEGNETAVDAVISEVNCDSVTEVVATETVGNAHVDEATNNKITDSDKVNDENVCLDASLSKDDPPSDNLDTDTKVESRNIDVIDIGSSVDVHHKGDSDSGLSTSKKVLVISSPGDSGFPENLNCNSICDLEGTEKGKVELTNLETDKNQSASEKTSDHVSDVNHPTASHSIKTSLDKVEHKVCLEHASSKSPRSGEDESSCSYNEETKILVKEEDS